MSLSIQQRYLLISLIICVILALFRQIGDVVKRCSRSVDNHNADVNDLIKAFGVVSISTENKEVDVTNGSQISVFQPAAFKYGACPIVKPKPFKHAKKLKSTEDDSNTNLPSFSR